MQEWTKEQLITFLENKSSGIVYFYTPMCGTCQVAQKMLTIIETISPSLRLAKANLNFLPEMAGKLTIESVPCLLFIQDGLVKEKIYTFQSVPFLYEKIMAFTH